MHLRNTLAKGMDAESYSLHTFEALLSQSMENLGECNTRAIAAPLQHYAIRLIPSNCISMFWVLSFIWPMASP